MLGKIADTLVRCNVDAERLGADAAAAAARTAWWRGGLGPLAASRQRGLPFGQLFAAVAGRVDQHFEEEQGVVESRAVREAHPVAGLPARLAHAVEVVQRVEHGVGLE